MSLLMKNIFVKFVQIKAKKKFLVLHSSFVWILRWIKLKLLNSKLIQKNYKNEYNFVKLFWLWFLNKIFIYFDNIKFFLIKMIKSIMTCLKQWVQPMNECLIYDLNLIVWFNTQGVQWSEEAANQHQPCVIGARKHRNQLTASFRHQVVHKSSHRIHRTRFLCVEYKFETVRNAKNAVVLWKS